MQVKPLTHFESIVLEALFEVVPEARSIAIDHRASLRGQLDIDSMDILNVAIAIHARCGIDVPERDYGALESVELAALYLSQHQPNVSAQ